MQRDEYINLFDLSTTDLNSSVLDYGRVSTITTEPWIGFSQPVTCCPSYSDGILPFSDFLFDLALCPYYLFTDENHQRMEFYLQQIIELARVAKEVRIAPLSDNRGLPSPLLGPVLLALQQKNYGIEVRDVTTFLHPEGSAMLRVWAQQCHVG